MSLNNAMLMPDFDPDVTTYAATAAYSAGERTMLTYAIDAGAATPEVKAGRSAAAADAAAMLTAVTRSTADVRLYNTGETVIRIKVTAENGTSMKTYTITVSRASEPSSDATLSSLSLMTKPMEGMGEMIGLMDMDGMAKEFMADDDMYYAAVENDVEMITVSAMAAHTGATVSGDGDMSLAEGENTVTVTVTAEDGTEMNYTVMVTRGDPEPAPGDGVCALYDSSAKGGNGNGMIDLAEAVNAVQDYQRGDGTLSLADAVQVVLCYQGN